MITFVDVYDSQTNELLKIFDFEFEDYHDLDEYLAHLDAEGIGFYIITRFLEED